jgi:HSP20 family protein
MMVSNLQEPTELFNRLQQDFNSLFKSSAEKSSPAANDQSNTVTGLWVPPINIHEADSQFFVSVNIPGINIRDIEMHIENGILSIKAEPKFKHTKERGGYYRSISSQGTFYRRFSLPESADPNQVTTKNRDGVLTITLGKRKT